MDNLRSEKITSDDEKLLAEAIIADLLMALGYLETEVDINSGDYVKVGEFELLAINEIYDHDWLDWEESLKKIQPSEKFKKPRSLFSYEFQKAVTDQLDVSFLFFLPVVILQRTKNMSLVETMTYLSVLLTGIQFKYPEFADEFFDRIFLDQIIGSHRNDLEEILEEASSLEGSAVNILIPIVLYDLLLAACHQPRLPSGTIMQLSEDEINTLQKIWRHPQIDFAEMLVNFNTRV